MVNSQGSGFCRLFFSFFCLQIDFYVGHSAHETQGVKTLRAQVCSQFVLQTIPQPYQLTPTPNPNPYYNSSH